MHLLLVKVCIFVDLFLSNEVDMAMFTTLTDQDLISIGISSFGARKIMLNAIQGIANSHSPLIVCIHVIETNRLLVLYLFSLIIELRS